MGVTKMLGKQHQRRMLVPSRGRCTCFECAIVRTRGQQRARERREVLREEEDVD